MREIGDRLTSPEFSELIALDNLYGFPDNYFLAYVIASAFAGTKAADALVPIFSAGAGGRTTADLMGIFQAIAAKQRS